MTPSTSGTTVKGTNRRVIQDSTLNASTETNRAHTRNKHLISLRVRGRLLKCLLDPASDLSLVSHDTVRTLRLESKVHKNKPLEILSALNSKSTLEQSIDLYFTLEKGNNQFIHTFHLLDTEEILGYSAIVGIDFLVANSAIVNYRDLHVSMWGEVVANLEPLVGAPPAIEVILARYLTVDECKEYYVREDQRAMDVVEAPAPAMPVDDSYITDIMCGTHLTGNDRTSLGDVCREFRDAFVQKGVTLGAIKNYCHSVKLTDETPLKMPQYQVPVKLRAQFKKKLLDYEACGIIERSNSPWNVPMFTRQKKNGDLRLVLDATAINNRTHKTDYPIFRINDTFNQLRGKTWFTNVDLRNGYHQILLDAKSRRYFAFRTPYGKYQYCRMPMGASNSGIFFQMVMETLLRDLIGENLIVYQDDILIATSTVAEHLQVLRKVLEIFTREEILINNEKSRFAVREVNFLGHVLCDGTFSPSNENLEALKLLSPPVNLKQLRGFIGKLNFYAKFLPALSHVISPLTDLLSTGQRKYVWEPTHEQVYREVQVMLSSHPILHYPDYTMKFLISIQVSESALIGVVEQGEGTGTHPVGYFSKKFNKTQRKYTVLEKNALAVISVLEHFHHIIIGYPVEVCSDRKPVEYLRNLKDGNTRVTDWMTKISKYAPDFVFSKDNTAITRILQLKSPPQLEDDQDDPTPLATAFTDGSCTGNGTTSAATGIGVHWENCTLTDYYGRPDGCMTNNRAELCAIIYALETATNAGFTHIRIVSDSMYAIGNIQNNLATWEANGWKSARNKPVENLSEFRTIQDLLKSVNVDWVHTRGHACCEGNNLAHDLASRGRSKNSVDGPSTASNTPGVVNTPEVLAIRTKEGSKAKIVTFEVIKAEQEKDAQVTKLRNEGTILDEEPDYAPGIRLYQDPEKGVFAKGIIDVAPRQNMKINAIYVPEGLRRMVIGGIHECRWVNHSGYMTTCVRLLERYFWSTFRRDTQNFLRTCEICQRNSPPRKKIAIMDFVKPTKPGQKLAIDIVGPIVTSTEGHRYILVMIDMFTRYAVMCPLGNIRADEVISCLERNYITIFGVPKSIVTDRGSNFRSTVFTQACQVLQVKHYVSSPYHPATNGMVERLNKEIKRKLTTLCNNAGRTWATKLHLVQFAQNNSYHGSINTSPNILTFGEDRNFPEWGFYESHPMGLGTPESYIDNLRKNLDEIRELAWEFEEDTRWKRNSYTNKNRVVPRYDVGDLVLYRSVKMGKTRNQGFRYIYDGPFQIKKRLSPVSYDIGMEGNDGDEKLTKRAHVERLRPFYKATVVTDEVTTLTTGTGSRNSPRTPTETTIDNHEVKTPDTADHEDSPPEDTNVSHPIDDIGRVEPETPVDKPGAEAEPKTEHAYNTRSKSNVSRRCYKHWQSESCRCHN